MKKSIFLLFILSASVIANAQIITTVAGGGSCVGIGCGDGGPATAAKLSIPGSVAFDTIGNMYIGDANNHRIRKVSTTGTITTIAGTGVAGYSGDGGVATAAELDNISGIAVDRVGNIYFTEIFKNVVRKISPSGIISTYAGTGLGGYSGDGGPATTAKLNGTIGIWVDKIGNVFFTDGGCQGVRKVSTTGIISTVAGNGTLGYGGDGGMATNAMLYNPHGVTVDSAGNIFIADMDNHRIRKVSPTGIITTIAGDGTYSYSGDGGPATLAKLKSPWGIVTDRNGNIYFSEYNSYTVRKISTTGIITTVAGNNTMGYTGDGGIATAATFKLLYGIALDVCENLYIADGQNNRIRKIAFNPTCSPTLNTPNITILKEIKVFPTPTNGELNIENINANTSYRLLNLVGTKVLQGNLQETNNSISVSQLPPGMYMLELMDEKGLRTLRKIQKQ